MQTPNFREQQGHYAPYGAFFEEYIAKFEGGERFKDVKDPSEIDDIIWGQPLFKAMEADVKEPKAINVMYDLDRITFNFLSQGARTMATSNSEDRLHCLVSGADEHVFLVTPFQRGGVRAGQSAFVKAPTPEDQNHEDEFPIPPNYSFIELDREEVPPDQ